MHEARKIKRNPGSDCYGGLFYHLNRNANYETSEAKDF